MNIRRQKMKNILKTSPWLLLLIGWVIFLIVHGALIVTSGFLPHFAFKKAILVGADVTAILFAVLLLGTGTWQIVFRLKNKVVSSVVFLVAIAIQLIAGWFLFVGMIFVLGILSSGDRI